MSHILALALAVCLDLVIGDPHCLPHPVRWMGRMIAWLERVLRRGVNGRKGELLSGAVLAAAVPLCFGLGGWLVLHLLSRWPAAAFAAEVWVSAQLLAARQLQRESMAVARELERGDLPAAREKVSMIVGRDTARLDGCAVARAAVETVAENTADGVIAPLLCLALGGVPLGLAYKAVNTMDSMVGYQNERYLYFGRAAARLDDAVNWIPARLSGLLMCAAAWIVPGMDGKGAWRVFIRDRKKHKSPNSAHTEAACAGALGLQLGGDSYYFGELVHKPVIGDGTPEAQAEDIARANRLMYATLLLACALLLGIPALWIIWGR